MKIGHLTRRLSLAKTWLCTLVGLSTFFGFLMATGKFSISGWLQGCGIFLLAMGGATFNSWQEREKDGQMQRTQTRPMVQGEFSESQAVWQAFVLATGGLLLLYHAASFHEALLALTGLCLYNLVYTPLKKRTFLAIFPGAVCGAIPPCVGWLGGGGSLSDYHFFLLFGLFFLWQIPHFWLVMLMHREDYIGGPYPSLLDHFPDQAVRLFFLPWIGALLTVMMLFALLPEQILLGAKWLIVLNCSLLGGFFIFQFRSLQQPAYRGLFIALNFSLVLHMGTVSLAQVIS